MHDERDLLERYLVPIHARTAWIETGVICSLIVLIGALRDSSDPFFLQSDFPWLVMAPLFAGMRYGFLRGFGAGVALTIAIFIVLGLGLYELDHIPAIECVGMIIIGMICGEVSDRRMRRENFLVAAGEYRRRRLDEFTRAFHLLKISHDRLEHSLIGQARSLRGSIIHMREQLQKSDPGKQPIKELGNTILDLYSSFGWIQMASLLEVSPEGVVDLEPCSKLGDVKPLTENDRLLRETLQTRRMVSIFVDDISGEKKLEDSLLLASIPLVDTDDRIWGILAIEQMPFMAFNDDNLRFLAVLGGHIGDTVRNRVEHIEWAEESEQDFLQSLSRCLRDAKEFQVPGACVGVKLLNPETAESIQQMILNERRGLDRILVVEPNDALMILLPQTDQKGLIGYQERLKKLIAEKTEEEFADCSVLLFSSVFDGKDQLRPLMESFYKNLSIERKFEEPKKVQERFFNDDEPPPPQKIEKVEKVPEYI